MANSDEKAPIIVKKVKKGGHGHHGGAWKVAYADFVTAMMAFFLLLWLLNVTTDEQKRGIADYFAPSSASRTTSGAGGVLGGQTMNPDGARISDSGVPSVVVSISPPPTPGEDAGEGESDMEDAESIKEQAAREEQAFEAVREKLRQELEQNAEFAGLAEHLMIDMTSEGLRIQVVDKFEESMFANGSAEMLERTNKLMEQIAKVIETLPNRISISGHTDATKFHGNNNYSNWELSSDRANASRRALIGAGLPAERIARVTGKADTEPLLLDDPKHPTNRRISIVLLREAALLPVGE